MWLAKILSFISTLSSSSGVSSNVDYSLTYIATGNNISSSQIFSTAFEPDNIIMRHSSLYECQSHCANNTNCLGLVEFEQKNDCVLLDNLGVPIVSDEYALSFTKKTTYEHRDNHTIYGEVWNSYPDDDQKIHTFYLDLNRNGFHDDNEPLNMTTTSSNLFQFTNVPAGNYLIREIPNDNCVQLWPGAWGYNNADIRFGDGFVDTVVQYFYNGHPDTIDVNGGVITNQLLGDYTSFSPAPLSLSLGNTELTFISFPPNHGVIYEFLDDVIVDGNGDDLVVNVFLNSSIDAVVSVSSNNIDYHRIGILNNTHKSFDLANYDINHVSYVKLDFFCNLDDSCNDQYRNIVSIQGLSLDKYFAPAYSAFVTVPQKFDTIFVKDCNYTYSCYTYCLYTRTTFDTVDSCMVGCDLWEQTGTCDCQGAIDRGIPFYGEDYQKNDCDDGCLYEINYNVFPDYSVKLNATGRLSRVTSIINCDEYDITGLDPNGCIKDILALCTRQPSCDAVSLANHSTGYLYSDEFYINQLASYFIVKRKKLDGRPIENLRYTTPTTTPTTSPTTTPTTTQTTSTTATSTPTSTQTTSPTSTPTTTKIIQNSEPVFTTTELGLLSTLLLIVLIFVILTTVYCYNKYHNKRKQPQQQMREVTTINHQSYRNDYDNPVFDIGTSFTRRISGTTISPSPQGYLDISPSPPRPVSYNDSNYFEVATIKQESTL